LPLLKRGPASAPRPARPSPPAPQQQCCFDRRSSALFGCSARAIRRGQRVLTIVR
jgi:hypothetical protein